MIPLILAPLLAQLAESGLNLIGNAVLTKGKQVVEEKLGVSLDSMVGTEQGKQALLQLQTEHEQFLITAALDNRKLDFELYKVDAEDRANARNVTADIQASDKASWAAKNFPYILDGVVVGGTLLLTVGLFFKAIPDDNLQIANIALGTLLTLSATVVNFHRGTSSSSAKKDTTIHSLSQGALK